LESFSSCVSRIERRRGIAASDESRATLGSGSLNDHPINSNLPFGKAQRGSVRATIAYSLRLDFRKEEGESSGFCLYSFLHNILE
jgi:hypothetical protein